ncbi:hypothetical protein [Paenibacillus sinopodophylli]|uniref:hypothetical protein n=1 Tax=Paenibacillus sinopodophylli TaxID=1837342 RepID=UPI00110CA392|nr:hypothetical protein [Paenibacillus sinopodophylli]
MLYASVALSACLAVSAAPSAYAGGASSLLDNQIGNELQAEFQVTADVDAEDTVVLSWDSAALQLDKQTFNMSKDVEKEVTYYVSPGVENDDDLTVSVLLKIPTSYASAVDSLSVDGNDVNSFVDGSNTYYLIKQGLEVDSDSSALTDAFDITFKAVSLPNTPFTASLLAVDETPGPEKSSVSGSLQKDDPAQHRDMILYLSSNTLTTATTGTLVVNLGEMTPNFSDGEIDGFLATDKKRIALLEEYYDAATHTFTIPVDMEAGDRLSVLRLNYPTYSMVPNSQITFKYDQDGDGTAYSFSDEANVRYTVVAPS